jgi:putative nucleotidyltransferase with HDIG domain
MHEELHRLLLEKIERRELDLPLLPESASRVLSLSDGGDWDSRKLADLIRSDQTLAGHLLRVANSPIFMPRSPIVSLRQALARLGMATVRQIVLVIACQTKTFHVKGHERKVRQLFQHSLCVAVFAQELARTGTHDVEEAFLAGLLHDVGRPVLLQQILDLALSRRVDLPEALLDAWVDDLHAQVGAALVASWGLPSHIAEAIAEHHADGPSAPPLTALIRLSDDLAHFALDASPVAEDDLVAHPMLRSLDMESTDMGAILGRKKKILQMVGAFV